MMCRLLLNFGAAKAQRTIRDMDQFQVDATDLNSGPQIEKLVSTIGLKAEEEGTTREQVKKSTEVATRFSSHRLVDMNCAPIAYQNRMYVSLILLN